MPEMHTEEDSSNGKTDISHGKTEEPSISEPREEDGLLTELESSDIEELSLSEKELGLKEES